MLSPRSRGKGGRRGPWRDGGRGKQKAVAWRKQATHAVEDLSQLSGDLAEVTYSCPFGRTAAEGIYLLDQEIAHIGIRYHAELEGSRLALLFRLRVPADQAEKVRAIIARVRKQ